MRKDKKISAEWDTYQVAQNRLREGNKVGALILLLNDAEDGKATAEEYALIGDIYIDLGMYDYALEYLNRFVPRARTKAAKARAYNAVTACACMLNDISLASFYYEEQLKVCPHESLRYDDIILDYFDEVNMYSETDNGFHSMDGMPAERAAWEADIYMAEHKYKEAYEQLAKIGRGNEGYVDARINMATCLSALGREQDSLDVLRTLTDDYPEDPGALLSYAKALVKNKNFLQARYYILQAADFETDNPNDLSDLAELLLRYCENETDKAEKLLDRCLKIAPYTFGAIMLKAQILCNRYDWQEGIDAFKLCYDLTRNPMVKYYYRKAREGQVNYEASDGDQSRIRLIRKFEFVPGLPDGVFYEILGKATELAIAGEHEKDKYTPEELMEIIDWTFSFQNDLQGDLALELLHTSAKLRNYFIDKLLSQRVGPESQAAIIEALLNDNYEKTVTVCVGGILKKVKLVVCDFGFDVGETFTAAYNSAFSKICLFGDYAEELRAAGLALFYNIKQAGNLSRIRGEEDLPALTGAMLYDMDYEEVENLGYLERIIGTSRADVKRILDMKGRNDD